MSSYVSTDLLNNNKPHTHKINAIKHDGQHLTVAFPEDVDELQEFKIDHRPSIPPGWNDFYTKTYPTLPPTYFHRTSLAPTSVEYQTLALMIEPSCNASVTRIDQVFNLVLWEKFLTYRKDMMIAKSQNFDVLRGLGQTDFQLAQLLSFGLNDPDGEKRGQVLGGVDYSDNICLLYHCTKGKTENVLAEGLDERIGNGGLLGRGIYFSDDPEKAMAYDKQNGTLLIFMVLLGDCLSWNEIPNVKDTTREPSKTIEQARTLRDRSFDSIAGTPNAQGQHNEFVIYNRNQCCPAFVVKYKRTPTVKPVLELENNLFYRARQTLPEFLWKKDGIRANTPLANIPAPGKTTKPYPFYAQTIFQLIEFYNSQIRPPPPVSVPVLKVKNCQNNGTKEIQRQKDEKHANALIELFELGFYDEETNSKLLVEHNYDLMPVIDALLELKEKKRQPGELIGPDQKKPKLDGVYKKDKQDPFAKMVKNVTRKGFNGAHSGNAIAGSSRSGPNGSGRTNNTITNRDLKSVKNIDFRLIKVEDSRKPKTSSATAGSGPNGSPSNEVVKLDSDTEPDPVPKPEEEDPIDKECPICFEDFDLVQHPIKPFDSCMHRVCQKCYNKMETSGTTIKKKPHTFIKCPFCTRISGTQIGNCPNGTMRVTKKAIINGVPWIRISYFIRAQLSLQAYLPWTDEGRKLVELLRIAWDRRLIFTTGQNNTLDWNIHHKTAVEGGEANNGYPDPTYTQRLRDELKKFGIQ